MQIINDNDIKLAAENLDFTTNQFSVCKNGLMLTNGELEVLKRYRIDYEKCQNLKELIFEMEEIIEENEYEDIDDLEYISKTISERDYYQNTNK